MTARSRGRSSVPGLRRRHAQRRDRQRDQQRRRPATRESSGLRITRSHDGAPEPRLARGAAQPPGERDPALVDAVAEPGQHRRQHDQRDEHLDRDDTTTVATANDSNVASPVMNMPDIAIITVSPEIITARPEVAGGRLQGLLRALAVGSLLALAAHVEERVVDADREPDQQDQRRRRCRRAGTTGSGSATSAIVAITPVSASSSGTPAATRPPSATAQDRAGSAAARASRPCRGRSGRTPAGSCRSEADAELLDVELGVLGLQRGDRVLALGRRSSSRRRVLARDLEVDQHGMPVLRDRSTAALVRGGDVGRRASWSSARPPCRRPPP